MPAAIPAALAVGAASAGMISWTVAALAIFQTMASFVLGKIMERDMPEQQAPGIKVNTRSTNEPLRVVYGTMRVGGNDVYMNVGGGNNGSLWIVQTLSEGPCDSIAQDGGLDQIWLNDVLESEFGGLVSYWFHDGASDQAADTNIVAQCSEFTDPLRNTCYIVWNLLLDRNYFQSVPDRTVLLKGIEVYDPRTSTTAWSDNPVLCLRDYLTNTRYGCGISSAKLDSTSWNAAATYCESAGWKCNVAFSNLGAQDVIDALLATFRGVLTYWGGMYYLRYADLNDEVSCMTLGDEHLARDEDGKAMIRVVQPSLFSKPDGLRVKFIDAEKGYTDDEIIIGEDAGVIEDYHLVAVTSRDLALRLGITAFERKLLDRQVVGTFRDDVVQLDPNDYITFGCSALGYSGKEMRVQSANIRRDGLIDLVLGFERADAYNNTLETITDETYASDLPDPLEEPGTVYNATVTEEVYEYRLRSFTRLKVAFDAPPAFPWFDHVEVWVSYDDTDYEHLFNATTDFEIDPVEEGVTYYIRLRSVSIWGSKSTEANDLKITHTVLGQTDPPDSLVALKAIVNQNTVNLYAQRLPTAQDIELYEFRLGASWDGGIFLGALRSPNLTLPGVRPGSHTFWVNTLSNNGQYGDTPRSAAVTLAAPPDGWAVDTSDEVELASGSFENCGLVSYDSDNYLKRATNAVLTNPGFEAGDMTGWTAYGTPTIQGTTKKYGSYAAYVTANGSSSTPQGGWQSVAVEAGKTYTAYFWLYMSAYTAGQCVMDILKGSDSTTLVTVAAVRATNGGWTLYSTDVTIPAGETSVKVRWYLGGFGGSNPNATAYFDEICMVKQDLTCTWLSAVCDLGASERFLGYIETVLVQLGDHDDWADILGSTAAWQDIEIATKTWAEIFGEAGIASKVWISIYVGDTNPPTTKIEHLEIFGFIATFRYYQLEVTIQDPDSNSFEYVREIDLKLCQ